METKEELIDYLYKIDWKDDSNIECYHPMTKELTNYSKKNSSVSYSSEEIDHYYIERNDEFEDLLNGIEDEFPVEKLKVTANIATQIDRLSTLLLTVESIKDQFDEIRIYLNDYTEVPDELKKYEIFYGDDLTDNAKFIWSDFENEYYFVIDDDIIYPPDYVEKTLPYIGNRIVCYSGKKINTSSLNSYYRNHRNYELYEHLEEKVEIDIVDTSTMAFNTNIFYSKIWKTPNYRMIDLLISLEAALHKIPIVCLPHKENWIKSIFRNGNSKFFSEEGDEIQSNFVKMISVYKGLKNTGLNEKTIFGRLSKESIDKISTEISKLKDMKNLYHIGAGTGTNLLHLSLVTDIEHYIGIDTEEYRIRIAKKTHHGKLNLFKERINFFKSKYDKVLFDENSILFFGPFIKQKDINKYWCNIPNNSIIITFENLPNKNRLNSMKVKLMSGEEKQIFFYKKTSKEIIDFRFSNIPYQYKGYKHVNEIPKIIHHIAPSDTTLWNETWKECYETWLNIFPDFEHKMWDDSEILELVKTQFPWYEKIYSSYDRNIKRYDIARLLIMYHYGGIYADMDYMVFKNFYEDIPKDRVSTPISPFRLNEFFQNALFCSPKGHVFWLIALDFSYSCLHYLSVLDSTGPKMISNCYYTYYPICRNMINILPCELYNPSFRTNDFYSENLIAKHICTNTWTTRVRKNAIWTDDLF